MRRARHALYDHAWREYSKRRLEEHPFCVRCRAAGRSRLALVTDHKIPHKGDPVLFRNPDNHQSLCETCHNRKTRLEDGGGGSKRAALVSAGAQPAPRALSNPDHADG